MIVVALLAMLGLAGCGSHAEHHEAAARFLVTSPCQQDTAVTKEYVCQIRSIQHIEVRALERGYLEKIYVDEGQMVKKGQLMFKIMPLVYQAELKKAEAEVKFAEIEYQNTKSLAESNVVAPTELALAEAKLNKAQAELALAKVHLQFTEVRAPFDGIMDHFHVRLGSLIEEGELLTTLSDNSDIWVYFNVPEAEYLDYASRVKKDSVMKVDLIMANNQRFPYQGVVTAIEADFDFETGNIDFRATIPNPDGLLRHGETGNISVRNPLNNALLIPQKATFEVLDKNYVFVVGEDNRIASREVVIAAEMPHLYAIKRGLAPQDRILLEGLRKVRENDEILVDFVDPKAAINGLELYAE